MGQWTTFLNSLALWALLLCTLLVLLPLQRPGEEPEVAVTQPILHCPRERLNRISFEEGTLLNLGQGFVLEEAPELPLDQGKVELLLTLLEQLPPGEEAPPPQGTPLCQLELQSILAETQSLALYEEGESLLLWDGQRCCRYPRQQLAPLLDPLASYAEKELLPSLENSAGSLRFWTQLLPEALTLDYSWQEEALLRLEGADSLLPQEPGDSLLHSLSGLSAAEAVALFPDQKELQKVGLDNPFCIIQLGNYKNPLLLCLSAPGEEGSVYALRQDLPLLFRLDKEALPFLDLCQESLSREPLFSLDYEALCSLEVETATGSRRFTKWQGQVLSRGRAVEEAAFGAFVRQGASPKAAGLPLWPEEKGPLLLRLSLGSSDPSLPQSLLSFWDYPPEPELALCSVDGALYTVERPWVEALLRQLEAL